MRHIYNPLRRRGVDKMISGAIVFFISAFFHEYLISGALGKLYYWSFLAMFANFPIAALQEKLKHMKVILFKEGY
jgi:diacylglycerol O-acyltransferase-1